jgi:glycine/D-amino acid oxidase-like deaminating enzyme
VSALPEAVRYVVIGAGIHGLSTAYHLALELKARGKGSGADILVLDKSSIGAGASGIACGIVRNDYSQPAMRQLMKHSIEVWESDPTAYSYHPVGRLLLCPQALSEQVAAVHQSHLDIGFPSELVEGEAACMKYMKNILCDWQARGITILMHEKKAGYANNGRTIAGLARKAQSEGVRIEAGVEVTGLRLAAGAVTAVETNQGMVKLETLVVGAGPWIKYFWEMLDLPKKISINHGGKRHDNVPMWTYWVLQEGTLQVDASRQLTNDGKHPPIIHVDSDVPLHSDIDGKLISDKLWGIYYKPDVYLGGVQGGGLPYKVNADVDDVKVDPYGAESPEFVVGDDFIDMWCSALAFCQKRFEGKHAVYRRDYPSGGIGAFTPDNFPIFDVFRQNCYVIADSNHGFKMIGVGKLVAQELMGERSPMLESFRFSRYETGELHPRSNSPFPWA